MVEGEDEYVGVRVCVFVFDTDADSDTDGEPVRSGVRVVLTDLAGDTLSDSVFVAEGDSVIECVLLRVSDPDAVVVFDCDDDAVDVFVSDGVSEVDAVSERVTDMLIESLRDCESDGVYDFETLVDTLGV